MGYAYAHDGEAVFTDVAATANNRVYTYEITGYDKWLAKTAPGRTGEVKVSHRGDIDRTLWTVSTNLTNSELEEPGEYHPDTYVQPGLEKMVDLETEGAVTTFTGSVKARPDAGDRPGIKPAGAGDPGSFTRRPRELP